MQLADSAVYGDWISKKNMVLAYVKMSVSPLGKLAFIFEILFLIPNNFHRIFIE